MDHLLQCRERAIEHANALRERVNAGKLNAGAVEGLMVTYLDQPAFEPEQRADLLQRALQYIGYRRWARDE